MVRTNQTQGINIFQAAGTTDRQRQQPTFALLLGWRDIVAMSTLLQAVTIVYHFDQCIRPSTSLKGIGWMDVRKKDPRLLIRGQSSAYISSFRPVYARMGPVDWCSPIMIGTSGNSRTLRAAGHSSILPPCESL